MGFWIYITGVIVAFVAFALVIYYRDKKMTVGTLTLAVLYSLFSWCAVLAVITASLYCYVDWDKVIWRRKE